jgi:hypothetical protein
MINPTNSKIRNSKNKITCPDCELELTIPSDTEKGENLSYPGCGLELEVKK